MKVLSNFMGDGGGSGGGVMGVVSGLYDGPAILKRLAANRKSYGHRVTGGDVL